MVSWAKLVPVSACRRADSLLSEEEAKAAASSDPVTDCRERSLDGRGAETTQSRAPSGAPRIPASRSQIEPETGTGISSQVIEPMENSDAAWLPGPGPQQGDPGGREVWRKTTDYHS